MKCQRCKKREANVQIVQQSPGQKPQNHYLCQVCAKELGIGVPSLGSLGALDLDSFAGLGDVFKTKIGLGADSTPTKKVTKCKHCNTTYKEFQATGLLGCAHCYECFKSQLNPLFYRTQMGNKQVGRGCAEPSAGKKAVLQDASLDHVNGDVVQIESTLSDHSHDDLLQMEKQHMALLLKEKQDALSEAIQKEDYALAARLRDEINHLTSEDKE